MKWQCGGNWGEWRWNESEGSGRTLTLNIKSISLISKEHPICFECLKKDLTLLRITRDVEGWLQPESQTIGQIIWILRTCFYVISHHWPFNFLGGGGGCEEEEEESVCCEGEEERAEREGRRYFRHEQLGRQKHSVQLQQWIGEHDGWLQHSLLQSELNRGRWEVLLHRLMSILEVYFNC